MTTQIQRRRGTTAEHASFAGAVGELTVDTDKNTVVVHDGATGGGFPLALEEHTHSASAISGSGVIAIVNGGTGASSAASALTALGAAAASHIHDTLDLTGFGSNIRYVDDQTAFASAYAGSSKTVVLAAGSYTLPGVVLPAVNVIAHGDAGNVVLSGGTWGTSGSADTASATTTVFRNIQIDGTLSINAAWNADLRLENVVTSILNVAAPESTVEVWGGEITRYTLSEGTLRTHGTKVTGAPNIESGGTSIHKDIDIDASSTSTLLQLGTGAAETTRVTLVGASAFVIASAAATHWQLFAPAGDFYVWYATGSAIDPSASGTGILVSASVTDSATVLAADTASAINSNANFSVTSSGATVTIVNASVGSVSNIVDVNASIVSISVTGPGIDSSAAATTIQGIKFSNTAGPGIQVISSTVATMNDVIAASVLTNGLAVNANAILNLGTHNLGGSASLVTTEQGTVVALTSPIGDGQIVTSNFAVGSVDSNAIEGSAVGRFHLQAPAKRTMHKTFVPIIGTTTGLGIPGGLVGSTIALAPNSVVIHPEFITDGYLRLLRIESVNASATPGSAMNFDLILYQGRAVGTDFTVASQITIASAQNFDSNGYVITRSALAQAASVAGVGSAAGAGFPFSGAADPEASVGAALVLSVSSIADASAIQDLMVSYLLQGADT